MALKKSNFTIKKFDGDSAGSYAVFRKEAVKGKGNIICWGEAQPIVCGLTKREADYYRSRCDAGHYL
jgi:hypothetical protein